MQYQGYKFMQNIIETAKAAGKFATLLTALKAADLQDTLKGKGPFTVFAPSDEAFKKVSQQDLDNLLKDTAKLKSILTYHVISGKISAKDIHDGEVKTLEGKSLVADTKANNVTVNGAKVVQADIAASNGVIHVIDTVIMPKGVNLAKAA
jgi:uncharacterized surface protein with fasciclin (FAS1) repeats